jgi:hypothetical protein
MVLKRTLLVTGIFVACVLVQLWLERTHRADSIGLWYTIYSAALYSIGILVALVLLRTLWRATRGGQHNLQ